MIARVEYAGATFAPAPRKFEAGTGNIADAIAFGVAVEYLEGVGMDWVREHERALTGYALERLARVRAARFGRSTARATPTLSPASSRSISPTSTRTILPRSSIPKASASAPDTTARCR